MGETGKDVLPGHALPFSVQTHSPPDMEGGPFGARSLAEHAVVALPSSVGNAISNATGIDFFELPMTSDKLLIRLKSK